MRYRSRMSLGAALTLDLGLLILGMVVFIMLVIQAAPAHARWKPEYANNPPEWREWYDTRELTEETRARLGVYFRSCCKHSDVVRTQFRVDRSSGEDVWYYWNPAKIGADKWERLFGDVVHSGDHAPDNQPTLFAYSGDGPTVPRGTPLCFFPGPGGI